MTEPISCSEIFSIFDSPVIIEVIDLPKKEISMVIMDRNADSKVLTLFVAGGI